MAKLLSYQDAITATKPYHQMYVGAHEQAAKLVAKGLQDFPKMFRDIDTTTMKAIMHDLVTAEVERQVGGIRLKTGGTPIFTHLIGDEALVRFKYLSDSELSPTSYPTKLQQALKQQQYTELIWKQLGIEGFSDPPTLLTCGYTRSLGVDARAQVFIVCHSPKLRYFYDLRDAADSVEIPMLPGMPSVAPRVVWDIPEVQEPPGVANR